MSKINELIKKLCPNGVEYKPLKDVFELFSGMTGVSNKWSDEGNCRFVDYMNAYKNNKIDIAKLPYATVKNRKQTILIQGDILLTSASEVPDECAIASVIEDKIQDGIFMDDHLFGLRLKGEYKNIINTTFISYYLNSKSFRCNLFKAVRGVTRFYISNKDYMKLTIPLPPIEVQEEIVRILDKFGELEAELEAELEERLKQYAFYKNYLLDYYSNNSYSNKEKFKPVDWELIGDLCTISRGRVISKEYIRENPGVYPVYSSQTENDGVLGMIDKYEYDGEFLTWTTDGANAGTVFYRNGKFNITNVCGLLKIESEKVYPLYLFYALGNVSANYVSKGMGNPKLMSNVMKRIMIPIPCIDEQKYIAQILSRFDMICNNFTEGIPAEIELRRKQYDYYRNKLLNFKELSVSE